ncbi:Hypothetical predicted protein, partial [Paramuricea clavata]
LFHTCISVTSGMFKLASTNNFRDFFINYLKFLTFKITLSIKSLSNIAYLISFPPQIPVSSKYSIIRYQYHFETNLTQLPLQPVDCFSFHQTAYAIMFDQLVTHTEFFYIFVYVASVDFVWLQQTEYSTFAGLHLIKSIVKASKESENISLAPPIYYLIFNTKFL